MRIEGSAPASVAERSGSVASSPWRPAIEAATAVANSAAAGSMKFGSSSQIWNTPNRPAKVASESATARSGPLDRAPGWSSAHQAAAYAKIPTRPKSPKSPRTLDSPDHTDDDAL